MTEPNSLATWPFDTSLLFGNPIARGAYRLVQPWVERMLGFRSLRFHYERAGRNSHSPAGFAQAALESVGVDWSISEEDRRTLAAIEGPLVLASNHPFGALDALALVCLLESIRPGRWSLLANRVVAGFPEWSERVIGVDPLNPEAASFNRRGMATALRRLRASEALLLFPAGRVSHRDPASGAVVDREWSDHPLRLTQAARATLVSLQLPGRNSARFLRVPRTWAIWRALLLSREYTHPPVSEVEIRVAKVLPPGEVTRLAKGHNGAAKVQAWSLLRADAEVPRPTPEADAVDAMEAVAAPCDFEELREAARELRGRALVLESGRYEVLVTRGEDSPLLLRELGRLREVTFRAAGQGTGQALDLAPEDDYYHHLLLWDREQSRLAGSYRLGLVDEILRERGPERIYSDHVFHFREGFHERLAPAIELSRSFLDPAYQKDRTALSTLWKGLGALAVERGTKSFFGSVTISNAHHPASRALLVEYLRRNLADSPDLRRLVRARNPFQPTTGHHARIMDAYREEPLEALAPLIHSLENGQRGIPPLMRYYTSLGARFLDFHVEAAFADALYCLLRVDIPSIPKSYGNRFFGKGE